MFFMEKKLRHQRTFGFLLKTAGPAIKRIFRYEYESLRDVPGPYLLLCNHNTDLDCALVAMAAGKQLYFVATENILRMGLLGKLVTSLFDPIVHYKGVRGTATVRAVMKTVRDGSSVCMFPEGNRSFNGLTCPIPPATGKLARSCGASLVTYRLRGGYLTWPRWGRGLRKGAMRGEVAGVYTHEELAAMTPEQVNAVIERDLFVDAYADQKKEPAAFKGKTPAENIESMLFMCPGCGRIGTLRSEKDRVRCSCGWSAVYDEYGMLRPDGGEALTLTELDAAQNEKIKAMAAAELNAGPDVRTESRPGTAETEGVPDPADTESVACPADAEDRPKTAEIQGGTDRPASARLLFSDKVTLRIVGEDHQTASEEPVELKAFADRFEAGSLVIPFGDVTGLAINQRNLLLIHGEGVKGHAEFFADRSFSALKYLYLFRAVKGSGTGIL